MFKKLHKLGLSKNELYNRSIIISLAHAIMCSVYPDLSYENSWDGINYNIQDSCGSRGTITFYNNNCVGAFRNLNSNIYKQKIDFNDYLKNVPDSLIKLAKEETLQYLLDDVKENIKPCITTFMWNIGNDMYSNDHIDKFNENSGNLLERHYLIEEDLIGSLINYYEMNDSQVSLLQKLIKLKLENPIKNLMIDENDLKLIGSDLAIDETLESFKELNVFYEKI